MKKENGEQSLFPVAIFAVVLTIGFIIGLGYLQNVLSPESLLISKVEKHAHDAGFAAHQKQQTDAVDAALKNPTFIEDLCSGKDDAIRTLTLAVAVTTAPDQQTPGSQRCQQLAMVAQGMSHVCVTPRFYPNQSEKVRAFISSERIQGIQQFIFYNPACWGTYRTAPERSPTPASPH